MVPLPLPDCAASFAPTKACALGASAHDEPARLEILDSAPEQPFENIVELVRQVLHVPICAVSLIDLDRQWFKAARGLSRAETPREHSFCTHAIEADGPFIVVDAAQDQLFANNPLVTGAPKIRSYVGIPLRTPDGYIIGTLCAADVAPRQFRQHEIDILINFARVAVGEIELRQIASTDQLTGIMSRRAWIDCAEREVSRARQSQSQLSFLMIDIDNFKAVNDRFGHAVGDEVIAQIARTIEGHLRVSDWLGRFGGEEFVIALPETTMEEATCLAERIRAEVSTTRLDCLGDCACTVSIGVATLNHSETCRTRALERADQGLFEAKRRGRNRTEAGQIDQHSDKAAA